MIPYDCLDKWLKEHPHANQAHRIFRYDRNWLVSYCGRKFPDAQAVATAQSVVCCPDCALLWRRQAEEKFQSLARKYPCKKRGRI